MSETGDLFCDSLKVNDISKKIGSKQFSLISKEALVRNFKRYDDSLKDNRLEKSLVSYNMRGYYDLHLLRELDFHGAGFIASCKLDMLTAELAGVDPSKIILST